MSFLKTTAIQHLNGSSPNINLDSNGNTYITGNVGIGTSNTSQPGIGGKSVLVTSTSGNPGMITAASVDSGCSVGLYSGVSSADNPSIVYQKTLRFGSTSGLGISGYTDRVTIDSSGRVTMPYQPAFRVEYTGGAAYPNGGVIVWNTVIFNDGNGYSNSTGRFTAPVTGRYLFSVSLLAGGTTSVYGLFNFQVNGVQVSPANGAAYQMYITSANDKTLTASPIIKMNAGDWLAVSIISPHNNFYPSGYNNFSGILLS